MHEHRAPATAEGEGMRPQRLSWMLAFFVLSGLSGLIYQSIWSQYLSLLLGSSAYAQSLVLSIFMGGMAAGAWIAAHLVGRFRNLLLAYGWIEGIVGLIGLVFHAVFLLVSHWLYTHWLPGLESAGAVTAARWLVAAVLILPQTILLGMTFPIMSAGLMRWMPERAGAVLGGLYFYNSIGAAAGALLATFVLVPAGGLPGAMGFAAILNLLILAGVYLARVPERGSERAPVYEEPIRQQAARAGTSERDGVATLVLLVACLTGLSSFMYEVGWIRMLSLALGTSQHAFELMLAAFIGGLALGGLYVRGRLDNVADPMRYAGRIQILMGLAALATLPLYDHAFVVVSGLMNTLAPTTSGYLLYNVATATIAIIIMLPAAFFAGMTLPVLTYVLLRRGAGESVIGKAYAVNTLGAILGVFAMVHLAMPAMGLKLSMVLAASIDLALGLLLLVLAGGVGVRRRLAIATAYCAFGIVAALLLAQFDPRQLHSGVYRTSVAALQESRSILYQADGKTASIALHGIPGETLTIATNGKPDASITMNPAAPPSHDEPTMVIAALLGLSIHAQAKDVAVIGFGSGLTTHTLASSAVPSVITTVEIEPRMVDAARGFGERVARAYDDPRSQIVIDDARAYFSGRGARYDLIVSEPSNPWVAGVAKLFSTEFYTFVKRHLKPDGLLVQWLQAYEISDATALTVLRALDAEFSDYALYLSNDTDIIIIATVQGTLANLHAGALSEPGLTELAELAGIRSLDDLRERLLADRARIRPLLQLDGGPANSDFRPVLADLAPRDRFMRARAVNLLDMYRSPLGVLRLAGLTQPNTPDAWRDPPVSLGMLHRRRQSEELAAGLLQRPVQGERREAIDDQRWRGLAVRLREMGANCFAGVSTDNAHGLLLDAFELLANFQGAEDLRAIFVDQAWVDCPAGSTAMPAPLLRVLSMVVDGDASAHEQISAMLARPDSELSASHKQDLMYLELLTVLQNLGQETMRARLAERLQQLPAGVARFQLELRAATLEQWLQAARDPALASVQDR